MPQEKDAFDEFLDTTQEKDAFGEIITPEVKEEVIEPKPRDNREARRAKEALQKERESNIELATRLQVLTETQKFRDEVTEPDEMISRIYGTNTPEGQEATRLLQKALDSREERAVEKALAKFQELQAESNNEVAKESQTLNQFIEDIEDEFDVDLTSSEQARATQRAYFAYLERMSPKDRDGNVKDYADPIATWEEFQDKLSRQKSSENTRAKDLGSRSMTRSGSSTERTLEDKASENYLKSIGVL